MVEVGEDDGHASADLAESVGHWHADFVEDNVGGSGHRGIRGFDRLCGHSLSAWDEYDCEPSL